MELQIQQGLVAVVVPLLIYGIKKLSAVLGKVIPPNFLPVIAPVLGTIASFILPLVGMDIGGPVEGAAIGSMGVGLRELAVKSARQAKGD